MLEKLLDPNVFLALVAIGGILFFVVWWFKQPMPPPPTGKKETKKGNSGGVGKKLPYNINKHPDVKTKKK